MLEKREKAEVDDVMVSVKKAVAAQDPAVLVLVSAQSHLLVAGYTRNQGGAVVSAPKSGSRSVILNLLRATFS